MFILILSVALAQVGIIDLIAKGYQALAYAFIAVFLLPLLTIGVYKIHIKRKEEMADRQCAGLTESGVINKTAD